jgi:hypothetical protein
MGLKSSTVSRLLFLGIKATIELLMLVRSQEISLYDRPTLLNEFPIKAIRSMVNKHLYFYIFCILCIP